MKHLHEWHERTGKLVLWADGARELHVKDANYQGGQYSRNDGVWWNEMLGGLRKNMGCVGAHLCGAYLRNRARKRGLRDEQGQPDEENLALITKANRGTTEWVRTVER